MSFIQPLKPQLRETLQSYLDEPKTIEDILEAFEDAGVTKSQLIKYLKKVRQTYNAYLEPGVDEEDRNYGKAEMAKIDRLIAELRK